MEELKRVKAETGAKPAAVGKLLMFQVSRMLTTTLFRLSFIRAR
jgi:hypothetical protein